MICPAIIEKFRELKRKDVRIINKQEKEKRKQRKKIRQSEEFKKRWANIEKWVLEANAENKTNIKIVHMFGCPIDDEIRRELERKNFSTLCSDRNQVEIWWQRKTK